MLAVVLCTDGMMARCTEIVSSFVSDVQLLVAVSLFSDDKHAPEHLILRYSPVFTDSFCSFGNTATIDFVP